MVQIQKIDPPSPINSLAFGLNAVEVMYGLCKLEQTSQLPSRIWSLPQYAVNYKMSAKETQYAVWGLQLAVQKIADAGYYPFLAEFGFAGETRTIGDLLVTISQFSLVPGNVGNLSSETTGLLANVTVDGSHPIQSPTSTPFSATTTVLRQPSLLHTGPLTIHLAYKGVSLRNKAVFDRVLAIMSFTVHLDKHNTGRFTGFEGSQGFKLTSELDGHGDPLLEYTHVYKIMRTMARWMVDNHKFQETNIILTKGDIIIARARFSSWEEPSIGSANVTGVRTIR